jgi:hypothetical protein
MSRADDDDDDDDEFNVCGQTNDIHFSLPFARSKHLNKQKIIKSVFLLPHSMTLFTRSPLI